MMEFDDPATSGILNDDAIVISGVAGIFPKSDNTLDLMKNLYNKVDMISEVEYSTIKHPSLPKHLGKIGGMEKFDAHFFRVTRNQAATLDPMTRKIMEAAYSAIFDAGVNPVTLAGTKLGVFVGTSYSDAVMNLYDETKYSAFLTSECSRTMVANRISYWLDAKGPSFNVDSACSSSMACLELAYNSLKGGHCATAIVGGCNYCTNPMLSVNLNNAGHLCMHGKTKCFDKHGNGYVRSDAINVIFLQRAKDAKRVYMEICHVKGKYFTRPDALFLPIQQSDDLQKFYKEFYSVINVPPSQIEYIEAFGSGIAETDSNELESIGKFFVKTKSLKVGSVKSNMGHTQAAAGICSVTKLCLAYHKRELPANLHYLEPFIHIQAIRDGKLQVVADNIPFSGGYTAMNNFSFTGTNFHALFKGFDKKKDKSLYKSSIPHLVLISGREEEGVNKILDKLEDQPLDIEQIALLHNVYKHNIPGHTGRSYTILDVNKNNETVSLARGFDFYTGLQRPVWFMYSGMGSQWLGMGTELLEIPIFAAAIEKCRKVLEPKGIDIIEILTSQDESIFDNNILNAMVGINAIQIGLTDIMKALGIVPDHIIGHSIGEIGCAYADGCLSAEESILSSCLRGTVSMNAELIRGSMAAVGLGYKDILSMLPPEIEVACHNGSKSCTLSGPADDMEAFLSILQEKGIFVKKIPTANLAYHSKYIAPIAPEFHAALEGFIKNPKPRSDKWISTSVPQHQWEQPFAKYASAKYFSNNLLNPVYFEENATLFQDGAIVIEIAPCGLMQSILKKSHDKCINISLIKRNCDQPVTFFLEAIGKLYQAGLNPQIDVLYPKVKFPVSSGTPFLSHLVSWDHNIDWPTNQYEKKQLKKNSAYNFIISIQDDEFKYLEGHIRNGVNEFSEAALLVLVWKTFSKHKGMHYRDMSVTFNDVIFYEMPIIEPEELLRFHIMIHKGSNHFEVTFKETQIVAIGVIEDNVSPLSPDTDKINDTDAYLDSADVYNIFNSRGYSYGGEFQSIQSMNEKLNGANIKHTSNWAIFLDSLIQLNMFERAHNGISKPKVIRKLTINVDCHKDEIEKIVIDGTLCLKAQISNHKTVTKCGGVKITDILFEDIKKVEYHPDVLTTKIFVPHTFIGNMDLETALHVQLQIVANNVSNRIIKILELNETSNTIISRDQLKVAAEITCHDFNKMHEVDLKSKDIKKSIDLLVVPDLLENKKVQQKIFTSIGINTFVLTLEKGNEINIYNEHSTMKVVSKILMHKHTAVLLKKVEEFDEKKVTFVRIPSCTPYGWCSRLQELTKDKQFVVIVTDKEPHHELLDLVKNINKDKHQVSFAIVDSDVTTFDLLDKRNMQEIQKKNTLNVHLTEHWGCYYNIPQSKFTSSKTFSLSSTTLRNSNNLIWNESLICSSSSNLVKVKYEGISVRDYLKATGKIKDNNSLYGYDFSGIDSRGKRVMGLVNSGVISNVIEADETLLWPIPSYWSMEEAATVPLPYAVAYYCLAIRHKVLQHHKVLITDGAGQNGQAMISICLNLGCTVFTTVDDCEQKQFLLGFYPKLKGANIFNNTHEDCYTKIKDVTRSQKCDIVINCVNDINCSIRETAMKCVGFRGTFLDLIDVDVYTDEIFGMAFLVSDRNYKPIVFSGLFRDKNHNDRQTLKRLIAEGISSGAVEPLNRLVHTIDEISSAFNPLSASKQRRVLINFDDCNTPNSLRNVTPRMNYSEGVHVIVCGEINSSIELIDHLILNGAKTIVINFKSNHISNCFRLKSRCWKKFDVVIHLSTENLNSKERCDHFLNVGERFGPVAGIFIVFDPKYDIDANIGKVDDYDKNFREETLIVSNVDVASRIVCRSLRFFVLIPLPSRDITYHNAVLSCENILDSRIESGLPALLLRTNSHQVNELNKSSILTLKYPTLSTLFNSMDISLKLNYNNVCAINFKSNKKILQSMEEMKDLGLACYYTGIHDECLALQDLIPMETQIMDYQKGQHMNTLEPRLIMIPGFEGHHRIFADISEGLKIQAVSVQMGPDILFNTIKEMAQHLINCIKPNLNVSSKFYILGYFFGVNVALEVVRLLEADGYKGVVFCLDSSPDVLREQLKSILGHLSDKDLENNIISHMYTLMAGAKCETLEKSLENINNWPEKVDLCVDNLKAKVNYSFEHIKAVLNMAYKRIVLAREYEPDFKLESEIVLLKGLAGLLDSPDDYKLSKYTNKTLSVFDLNSDHMSSLRDCRVANIINKTVTQDY